MDPQTRIAKIADMVLDMVVDERLSKKVTGKLSQAYQALVEAAESVKFQ